MVKTTLKIEGMMCGMCEAHINDLIRREFKVKKVSSSHINGEAVVISDDDLPFDKLKSAIDSTGYTLTDAKSEEYEKKSFFDRLRGK